VGKLWASPWKKKRLDLSSIQCAGGSKKEKKKKMYAELATPSFAQKKPTTHIEEEVAGGKKQGGFRRIDGKGTQTVTIEKMTKNVELPGGAPPWGVVGKARGKKKSDRGNFVRKKKGTIHETIAGSQLGSKNGG